MRAIAEPDRASCRPTRSQTRAAVRWAAAHRRPGSTCASPRFRSRTSTPDDAPFEPGRPSRCATATTSPSSPSARWSPGRSTAAETLRARGHRRAGAQHALRRSAGRRGGARGGRARRAGIVTAEEAHRHRRPRRRGRERGRPAPARADADPRRAPAFRAHRQRRVPARTLRPDRRRHRRRRASVCPDEHALTASSPIDQGTSATKALLVDGRGAIVARGAAPVGRDHPRPGWVEQYADEIWAQRPGGRSPLPRASRRRAGRRRRPEHAARVAACCGTAPPARRSARC